MNLLCYSFRIPWKIEVPAPYSTTVSWKVEGKALMSPRM